MTSRHPEVTTVYIAAVGGQGGALLTDWLLAAATQMRYQAHSVGIPGMSQRGGATSYYVEMAPEEAAPEINDALLSPAPFLGEVDCLVGLELLELGRAVQSGYSSEKTVVVGSTHRDYTILEKLPSYGESREEGRLLTLLERSGGRLLTFDARAVARAEGMTERHVNAVLLGAVAAAGALPFREEAFRLAIKAVGVAPDLNLRAFDAGLSHALAGLPALEEDKGVLDASKWREELSPRQLNVHGRLMTEIPAGVNGELRSLVEVALGRLIDYQDEAYARRYLEKVLGLWRADEESGASSRLTRVYARHLANLMSYEDPIRVATLKSDPKRFQHIEAHHGLKAGQTYRLRERFQPELEELYGLLPVRLVRRFKAQGADDSEDKQSSSRKTFPLRIATTSLLGMALLKFLSALKSLRPRSWRRWKEEALQESYTQGVISLAEKSYELACLAAQAGGIIRGYGAVRRRTESLYRSYLEEFLLPLASLDERLAPEGGYSLTLRAALAVQGSLKPTGAGFEEARSLAVAIQEKAAERSYDELLEMASHPQAPLRGQSPSSPCCG